MGDKVFALNKELTRIVAFEVDGICTITTKHGTTISYHDAERKASYNESRCFATKEELVKSLSNGD